MVTFVCGMVGSGKSTYIKEHFPNAKVLDIYDFQKKQPCICVSTVLKAQEEGLRALLEAALEGDVVMEHTLLTKHRRNEQVEFLRDNGYVKEIHLVFLNPPFEELVKRGMERGVGEGYIKDNLEIIELPTQDEPFSSISIIGG